MQKVTAAPACRLQPCIAARREALLIMCLKAASHPSCLVCNRLHIPTILEKSRSISEDQYHQVYDGSRKLPGNQESSRKL
jgi:hypothetical protein